MFKELGCSRCSPKCGSSTSITRSRKVMHGWRFIVLTCFLFTGAYAKQSTGQAPSVQPMDVSQVRTVLNSLKMINYYPADNAQTNMWRNWNTQVLNRDLARI